MHIHDIIAFSHALPYGASFNLKMGYIKMWRYIIYPDAYNTSGSLLIDLDVHYTFESIAQSAVNC